MPLQFLEFSAGFQVMASGAGSSGAGRGRGTPSLNDNKSGESKDSKPNPKMSKALSTSAKRCAPLELLCDILLLILCLQLSSCIAF